MRKLVIIPTYNERENIESMICTVLALHGSYDLLIVDDSSPDGTAEVVKAYRQQYPDRLHLIERSGKQGLGTAYLAGFRWGLQAGYDLLFEMDCDFSHNPEDLERLAAPLTSDADVAIGSRYVKGGHVVNWPLSRLLISWCGSLYVRLVTWMPVHDTTAGFVGYRRQALERIDFDAIRMKGYGFQVEMKYTAWQLGLRLCEIPITFTERRVGASKMSGGIFSEALWGVLKLRFRKIRSL
ncbi:MAG: polyprenol monophosphomannose synthase [Alistipes sp.]|nr:polyprenol monophosphomannose synthase [Alistipes sp.]